MGLGNNLSNLFYMYIIDSFIYYDDKATYALLDAKCIRWKTSQFMVFGSLSLLLSNAFTRSLP